MTGRLKKAYLTVQHYLRLRATAHFERAAGVMQRELRQQGGAQTAAPAETNDRFLLFFGGGARGNPGPGDSGAVVVRIGENMAIIAIIWVSSMYYAAPTTTNNTAEYMGLLAGLRAWHRYRWSPVHVIGDSKLSIDQFTRQIPPSARHLVGLHWQCCRLAEHLQVLTWQHHLRSHNTMANALANRAMDTRHSVQVRLDQTDRFSSCWTELYTHVDSDVGFWFSTHSDETLSRFGPHRFNDSGALGRQTKGQDGRIVTACRQGHRISLS
ncbi:hypothetical protein PC110_g9671 [Phytophthora cactorum]|uniref:RNase H type-1 domain-containing protein n=1 Tax=Phytophthora cactorum TaxID=29920 RepID=A0A329SEC3_9STRA|nr:hypothetical protein PC110_g9671 [Phytophthora cactorum]